MKLRLNSGEIKEYKNMTKQEKEECEKQFIKGLLISGGILELFSLLGRKIIHDKKGQLVLNPASLAALITGIAGLLLKSNLLLIIAGLIFLIPFLITISLPTSVYVIGVLLIIITVVFGGKRR